MHVASLVLVMAMVHQTVPSAHPKARRQVLAGSQQSKTTRHRRLIFRTPLKGSHDALIRANRKANDEELERIQDDAKLEELTRTHVLVALPLGASLRVDNRLPEDRRYCRPWTASFLLQLGIDYYSTFKQPLQVTSAVRTVEYQEYLRRRNHNAAPPDGETASLHLTGAAVDIAKAGMGRRQIKWTRDYLLKFQNDGLVDAAEEFRQRVFHITVYKDYDTKMQPAAVASNSAALP